MLSAMLAALKCAFGLSFVETYTLRQAMKKFGDKAKKSGIEEMKQLHDRVAFKPVHKKDLTEEETKKSIYSLLFFVTKKNGILKGRQCANESPQRAYTDREEAASPTASTDSVLISASIDAQERRDVASIDVPNAFIQTMMPIADKGDRIAMKLTEEIVDPLLEIDEKACKDYVVMKKGRKTLYA